MNEREPVAAHYDGYRVFEVVVDRLRSFAADYEYTPGVNLARCREGTRGRSRKDRYLVNDPGSPSGTRVEEATVQDAHGPIPAPGCGCGFWLYHTEEQASAQFRAQLDRGGVRHGAAYGDFGGASRFVLGKVTGGGLAIIGTDGARVAELRIDALVTTLPEAFVGVSGYYGIGTVGPRTKADQGITSATVVEASEREIMLDRLDTDAAVGSFRLPTGFVAPEVGAFVVVRFEVRDGARWVVDINVEP